LTLATGHIVGNERGKLYIRILHMKHGLSVWMDLVLPYHEGGWIIILWMDGIGDCTYGRDAS
jgi:hypothetical protein